MLLANVAIRWLSSTPDPWSGLNIATNLSRELGLVATESGAF